MRIKNIAFSGFALAVVMTSAAHAVDATEAKIASQAYVDRMVGGVSTTLTENYTNNTNLGDTIVNKITAELDRDDSAISQALAEKEDSANKVSEITDSNKDSEKVFPTVGAVTQYLQGVLTDGVTVKVEAGSVNTLELADGAVTTPKLADDAVTTVKIADKNVTAEKLSDELQGKIDNILSTTEIQTEIKNYSIPKPSEDCTAESGRCVLSVDTDGELTWVEVTAPLGE